MPPPNCACTPFPAGPIIPQFIHVWGGKKGRFQKNLWKIHGTGAEKHKPAHIQGQCRDSPCDPHELSPVARFLLQHHAEPTWPYPSPAAPATVCDSTARPVSVREGIFAEYLRHLWPQFPCQRTQCLQLHFNCVGIVWAHSCCHSCFRKTFS